MLFSLSHVTAPSNDRIVIRECSQNSKGAYVCNPSDKSLKPISNWTVTDGEIIWDIGVTVESKNMHYKNETFQLELTNNFDSTHNSIFNNFNSITIKVK